jgi:hypothetical protein
MLARLDVCFSLSADSAAGCKLPVSASEGFGRLIIEPNALHNAQTLAGLYTMMLHPELWTPGVAGTMLATSELLAPAIAQAVHVFHQSVTGARHCNLHTMPRGSLVAVVGGTAFSAQAVCQVEAGLAQTEYMSGMRTGECLKPGPH